MPCYHPLPARQDSPGAPLVIGGYGTRSGKNPTPDLWLPCGKCIGCKADRATRWAHRCMHEASLWTSSIFLTLTYDEEHLPHDGHLQPKDLQLFIKRLRRCLDRGHNHLDSDRKGNLRFFACGEYGERNDRPHYHALLFNLSLRDGQRAGKDLFTSSTIQRLWPHGINRYGAVTAASASYVAQYSVKAHGRSNCDADGVYRQPPFLRMSRRPAIGLTWLQRFAKDLQHGYLIQDGKRRKIPRYYLERLKRDDPQLRDDIIQAQYVVRETLAQFSSFGENQTPERRLAKELEHRRRKQLAKMRG